MRSKPDLEPKREKHGVQMWAGTDEKAFWRVFKERS
jgi:hypothetical protein